MNITEKKEQEYQCYGKQGCYWQGDKPVKHKGKAYCPVCGSEAVKTPKKIKEDITNRIDLMLIDATTFGKQKSKGWFKFRGLIASVKNKAGMTEMLKKLEDAFKAGEINQAEFQHLTNMALMKNV